MRRVVVSLTSVAASAPVPLDVYRNPFSVGIGCTVGAATYDVQYTYDDVLTGTATKWFTLSTISAKTTDADGVISAPVSAVRLNVTSYTSGTVTMTVIQAGPNAD